MKIYFGKREDYFKPGKFWEEIRDDVPYSEEVENYEFAKEWLKNKLEELGFTAHYYNCNFSKKGNWIELDFGSWRDFVLLYEMNDEDWRIFFG